MFLPALLSSLALGLPNPVGGASLALHRLARARVAVDPPALLPRSFTQVEQEGAGGSLWQGLIPDPAVPALKRPTLVYLPPNAARGRRYPVLYLLEGFPGSPYEFSDGLRLGEAADTAIAGGEVRGFIAVIPPAGVNSRFNGEWTGIWEDYVVNDVVPWIDVHLPTEATGAGRAVAGLSAGGYGALDIGLRHPTLFGTMEAWSGYFRPSRDGSLRHADGQELAAHDPSLLVRTEAARLRRLGTRFYLSSGTTGDHLTAASTRRFAEELASLRLPYELWLRPGRHDGRFWRSQLGPALRYALSS